MQADTGKGWGRRWRGRGAVGPIQTIEGGWVGAVFTPRYSLERISLTRAGQHGSETMLFWTGITELRNDGLKLLSGVNVWAVPMLRAPRAPKITM